MWGPWAIDVGTKGEEKTLQRTQKACFPTLIGARLGWTRQEAGLPSALASELHRQLPATKSFPLSCEQ